MTLENEIINLIQSTQDLQNIVVQENEDLKKRLLFLERRSTEYQAYFPIPRPIKLVGLGLSDAQAKAFSFKNENDYTPIFNNQPCYYNIKEFVRIVGFSGKDCELNLIAESGFSPDQKTYISIVRFNEQDGAYHKRGKPNEPHIVLGKGGQKNIEIKSPSFEKTRIIIKLDSIPDGKDFSGISIINLGKEQFTLIGIEFFKRVRG